VFGLDLVFGHPPTAIAASRVPALHSSEHGSSHLSDAGERATVGTRQQIQLLGWGSSTPQSSSLWGLQQLMWLRVTHLKHVDVLVVVLASFLRQPLLPSLLLQPLQVFPPQWSAVQQQQLLGQCCSMLSAVMSIHRLYNMH
jgi:hypothetical protein